MQAGNGKKAAISSIIRRICHHDSTQTFQFVNLLRQPLRLQFQLRIFNFKLLRALRRQFVQNARFLLGQLAQFVIRTFAQFLQRFMQSFGQGQTERLFSRGCGKYVRGNVHTNGLENFWCLLKRCFKGTYVSVEPFHLFRYLDEQVSKI